MEFPETVSDSQPENAWLGNETFLSLGVVNEWETENISLPHVEDVDVRLSGPLCLVSSELRWVFSVFSSFMVDEISYILIIFLANRFRTKGWFRIDITFCIFDLAITLTPGFLASFSCVSVMFEAELNGLDFQFTFGYCAVLQMACFQDKSSQIIGLQVRG